MREQIIIFLNSHLEPPKRASATGTKFATPVITETLFSSWTVMAKLTINALAEHIPGAHSDGLVGLLVWHSGVLADVGPCVGMAHLSSCPPPAQ